LVHIHVAATPTQVWIDFSYPRELRSVAVVLEMIDSSILIRDSSLSGLKPIFLSFAIIDLDGWGVEVLY
jgi:hypothetical protein